MPDPFDRDRLLHYMRGLADPDTGRRAAAARGVAQFIKQHGLEWDDILVKQQVVAGVAVPTVAPPRWPHVEFADVLVRSLVLTPWEKDFLTSIAQWQRPPTDKQCQVLVRMFDKHCSHVNGLVDPVPGRAAQLAVAINGRFAPHTFAPGLLP